MEMMPLSRFSVIVSAVSKVVGLLSRKDGTTLAVLEQHAGQRALLIDLDSQSSAAALWRAPDAEPPALEETQSAQLRAIEDAAAATLPKRFAWRIVEKENSHMTKPGSSLTDALAQKHPAAATAEPGLHASPKQPQEDDGQLVTSLYLRAELMTELKILAVQRRCRVNDLIVEAIETCLARNGKDGGMIDRPSRISSEASWQAGYDAGTSGIDPLTCPLQIPDALAYQSGYIEGEAARRRARAATVRRARARE